jgi:hypothetical protein
MSARVIFVDMMGDEEPRIVTRDSFQVTGASLRDDDDELIATLGPLGWTTTDDGQVWSDWTISSG